MTRTRAILAATSIAAAAALLVAGCDSEEPAKPTPEPTVTSASPEPSASPSPTATVAAPERPHALDDDGPAGAEAGAVYFLELDGYIMKTGDTAEWEAMSHKTCGFCANRLEQANEIANAKYSWQGGEVRARVTHTYQQDSGTGIWPIDVDATVSPVSVTDSNGDEVFTDPRANTKYRVEMTQANDQWVVVGIADQPKP